MKTIQLMRGFIIKKPLLVISIQFFLYLITILNYFLTGNVPISVLLLFLLTDILLVVVFISSFMNNELISNQLNIWLLLISTCTSILVFAFLYTKTGIKIGFNDISYDLSTALYFSSVTWTSLGYGDVAPTVAARKWVVLEVFFGYIHMSVMVGLIIDSFKNHKS